MKVAIIVSVWVLLTGGVGEEVLAGGPRRDLWPFFLFHFAVSVLTALAVWSEFEDDAPPADPSRRRRVRWLIH